MPRIAMILAVLALLWGTAKAAGAAPSGRAPRAAAARAAPEAAPAAEAVACGPRAARTLARDSVARVYVSGHSVLGCAAGGAATRLGGAGPCPGVPQVGAVALAGRTVAYALRTCGVDTSSAQVAVRALGSGRRLHVFDGISGILGPESFVTVGSVVVTRAGVAAWIASASSIATHRSVTQVLTASGGRPRVVASGAAIAPGSLHLTGSTLSWRAGAGRRHTAAL